MTLAEVEKRRQELKRASNDQAVSVTKLLKGFLQNKEQHEGGNSQSERKYKENEVKASRGIEDHVARRPLALNCLNGRVA
jgi:hypothetical protein